MSSSTHQIKVKAVDQTGGAFSSIQKRAAAAGANIRKMLGAAIAAGAGYLGVRAFMAGADELGRLSDVAMKASVSVDELTSAATAFGVLGINANVDQIATAFTKMAQTTGRTGMTGFYKTIEELGKISDISLRSQQTMKVFGKAGIEFLPLINAAKDSSAALQSVVDAMPKVSQAAADAGDKLADAKTIGAAGFKKIWLEVVGTVANAIDESFKGGIREAAMDGVSYFTYFAKFSYNRIKWLFDSIGIIAGAMHSNWSNIIKDMEKVGESFLAYQVRKFRNAGVRALELLRIIKVADVKPNSTTQLKESVNTLWKDIGGSMLLQEFDELIKKEDSLKRTLEDQLKKNEKAAEAISDAAISSGDRATTDSLQTQQKKPTISNKLILGGSADALKLSMLGPQAQNEMKKQTSLLQQIKDNTKKTADNTDDIDPNVFDLSEVN